MQALHIPTELVINPREFYRFIRPGFVRDRHQRYLAWYYEYLRPADSKKASAALQ